MTSQGIFTFTLDDIRQIATVFARKGSVAFPYSNNQSELLIIHLDANFVTLGDIADSPEGRCYIGIQGKGCAHVPFLKISEVYFEDYLKLDYLTAKEFAKLWNAIIIQLKEMSGVFN